MSYLPIFPLLGATLGWFLAACSQPAPSSSDTPRALAQTEQPAAALPQPDTARPAEEIPAEVRKLMAAYPDHIKGGNAQEIIWADGSKMRFDDAIPQKSFRALLDSADLQDQFAFAYPKGKDFPKPDRNQDPGRVRYEPFFFKMYGANKQEVQKKLTTIRWMPKTYNVALQVTTVNNVHKRLEAISAALDARPHLHKYLANPGGTFNWRNIAGTNRLSAHSFGMTIDINVEYSDYWRWAVRDKQEDSPVTIVYKNRIPMEIVEIFEENGFIWGGKWYHYDTMHFEYRPELL